MDEPTIPVMVSPRRLRRGRSRSRRRRRRRRTMDRHNKFTANDGRARELRDYRGSLAKRRLGLGPRAKTHNVYIIILIICTIVACGKNNKPNVVKDIILFEMSAFVYMCTQHAAPST